MPCGYGGVRYRRDSRVLDKDAHAVANVRPQGDGQHDDHDDHDDREGNGDGDDGNGDDRIRVNFSSSERTFGCGGSAAAATAGNFSINSARPRL